MKDKLKEYVELLFAGAEKNEKNLDLKEELLGNLYDKYDDFIAAGMSEDEAYRRSISGIGNIDELFEKAHSENKSSKQEDTAPMPKVPLYSDSESAKKKKLQPILTSISIALYILCVVPTIIFENNIGVVLMFLIIAFATAMIIYTSSTKPVLVSAQLSDDERKLFAKNRSSASFFRALSVALYILCVTPLILHDSLITLVLMFVIIAAATVILILIPNIFPTKFDSEPQFPDGSDKSVKSESKEPLSPLKMFFKIISGLLWAIVVAIYLAISFYTGKWWITWVIFPIAGMISGIVSGIFNLVSSKKIAGSIVKISICSILLFSVIPMLVFGIKGDIGEFSFISGNSDFYTESDDTSYTCGEFSVAPDMITDMDIYWISGNVKIERWEEDHIYVYESSDSELSEDKKMRVKYEHGTLTVKFSQEQKFGVFSFDNAQSKQLVILLPKYFEMNSLDLEVVSADIKLDKLIAKEADISAVSGKLSAQDCVIGDISAEAVSGDITIVGVFDKIDFQTVSGKVNSTFMNSPRDISIECVSGNATLTFPEDIAGFTLDSDSVSGKLTINRPTSNVKGRYVFGDGSTKIDLESVSGNVVVN